jgi:hypothetical protein
MSMLALSQSGGNHARRDHDDVDAPPSFLGGHLEASSPNFEAA